MAGLAAITVPAYVLEPARSLRGGGIVGLAVLVAFELGLLAIAERRVFLEVDEAGATLTLRHRRWPLPTRTERIPLADVKDVKVDKARRSLAVRLVLVLHSGTEHPLTNSYFGISPRTQRDVEALRELCGRK